LLIHGKEIFAVHSRMAKARRTATTFFPVVQTAEQKLEKIAPGSLLGWTKQHGKSKDQKQI
jgi:hypothetical protein